MPHPGIPIGARHVVDLVTCRRDACEMRGGSQRRFLDDPFDGRMSTFPRRSAGAVGDRNEARAERLESLDRLPQRLLHLLRLRREEFEADLDVAARFGEERKVTVEPFEGVHAALRCGSAALTPRHNVTVSSPPFKCWTWSTSSPAAANQPAITSSSKP